MSTLKDHSDWVRSIARSPDCRLASGSSDTVRIWDTVTGQSIYSLEGHSASILAVKSYGDIILFISLLSRIERC